MKSIDWINAIIGGLVALVLMMPVITFAYQYGRKSMLEEIHHRLVIERSLEDKQDVDN